MAKSSALARDAATPTLLMWNGKGVAVRILGGTGGLYAILAGVRNCPGVTPTTRLK